MTQASSKESKASGFARRYRAALSRYLKRDAGARPASAVRLGREAVALGMETLDLAVIHEKALIAQVIPVKPAAARNRFIRRTGKFFAEAIIPMEETHRTALEASGRLSRLNQALDRRTRDLLASNREMKREVEKRKVVEQALRKSESQSNRLLDESRRMQEELRYLSRRILSTQEEERKRISRELHDIVAQTLTGINVHLATLKTEAAQNTRGFTKNIVRTQKLVEKSVDKVHRFARELRPAVLDDLGLIPALHALLKSFAKETGIRVSLTAFAGVEKLGSAKRTALYRVAQEALSNIARHARATRVAVNIKALPNAVCMIVKDDGQSFDVERLLHTRKNRRMGLLGMRERVEMVGGKFTIESAPGEGTTVRARLPLRNGDEGHARP